ncbi:nucleoside recognition domain-containing protein [Natranaerofaba carboxydovora]|uniref:nucleoside recognition domain-containing protein n=1 Tax=Natranaerofaba carboxydovora TaxID=2742683 RepID=UPI001F12DDE8|nr:nucleoside recognition domain-containing protein [Natranaerofaba carboxydovora]UMZ72673.1 Nucleoside recognition [Natranaerofaba carboxydovora]
MQELINLILESGSSGIDLTLYTIVPIMVVMMAVMKLLEDIGFLNKVALFMAPLLGVFGLPGLGVFAMLQCMLISFAAPIATLKLMDKSPQISGPNIAATMATVLTISQANAAFPLAASGLSLTVVFATSVVGGLVAGLVAYKISYRFYNIDTNDSHNLAESQKGSNQVNGENSDKKEEKFNVFLSLYNGAEEGFWTGVKAAPVLILALFVVDVLKETSVISLLETILTPVFTQINIPGSAVLPIVTKFLAGGTAMMGITMDVMAEGNLSVQELNRIAGIGIHSIDPVAISLFATSGLRLAKQIKPAIIGGVVGIIFRAIFHIIFF